MTSVLQKLQSLRTPDTVRTAADGVYDEHLKAVSQALQALDSNAPTKAYADRPDLLQMLDPFLDTPSYLAVLAHQIKSISTKKQAEQAQPGGALWESAITFLQTFNAIEARYFGSEWRSVVESVAASARQSQQPELAIQPILTAILRLDPTGATLTSSHLLLLRLCMESRAFREPLPLLAHEIHAFPSTPVTGMSGLLLCSSHPSSHAFLDHEWQLTEKMTATDVQEYFVLGATIYIALRQWARALYYLELALVVPANGTNALMLEAYRKWLLVSLIVRGKKANATPIGTAPAQVKTLKSASKVYLGISDALKRSDQRRLHAEIVEAAEILTKECNAGLAAEVLKRHQRLFVDELRLTYRTIPITYIAEQLGRPVDEMAEQLQSYIADGGLEARIEDCAVADGSKQTFVRFHDTSQANGAASVDDDKRREQELKTQTQRLALLEAHVEEADRRLALTREYLGYTARTRRAQQRSGSDDDAMDTFDMAPPQDADEDMMGD